MRHWRYREPQRSDYETDEEYEDAYGLWDSACADYIERMRERHREMRRRREED